VPSWPQVGEEVAPAREDAGVGRRAVADTIACSSAGREQLAEAAASKAQNVLAEQAIDRDQRASRAMV
jgi:hypothetical protein